MKMNRLLDDLRLLKKYNAANTYFYLINFLNKFIKSKYVTHSYSNNSKWKMEIIAVNENFHYTTSNETFPEAIILIATFYEIEIEAIMDFTEPYIWEALL